MSYKFMPWFAAAVLLVSGAAWASESPELGAADLGLPMAQEALDERRAGDAGLELNFTEINQRTRATLEHNTAIATRNGANHISGDSFRDATGFPMAVQNTGNNVIIQNAVIINLDMQ